MFFSVLEKSREQLHAHIAPPELNVDHRTSRSRRVRTPAAPRPDLSHMRRTNLQYYCNSEVFV